MSPATSPNSPSASSANSRPGFLAAWNWKAAALSAVVRSTLFLLTNLRAGRERALHAAAVEAGIAVVAAGVMGAITQRLRFAKPVWATGFMVWLGLPGALVGVQYQIHRWAGTPHLRTGLILSFLLASMATGFSWFAQRRGVLLAGGEAPDAALDARALPRVIWDFFMALPRALRS